jgi:hypothetical protein
VARDDYFTPDAAILHKQVALGFVVLMGDIDVISGSLYFSTILHSFCNRFPIVFINHNWNINKRKIYGKSFLFTCNPVVLFLVLITEIIDASYSNNRNDRSYYWSHYRCHHWCHYWRYYWGYNWHRHYCKFQFQESF